MVKMIVKFTAFVKPCYAEFFSKNFVSQIL